MNGDKKGKTARIFLEIGRYFALVLFGLLLLAALMTFSTHPVNALLMLVLLLVGILIALPQYNSWSKKLIPLSIGKKILILCAILFLVVLIIPSEESETHVQQEEVVLAQSSPEELIESYVALLSSNSQSERINNYEQRTALADGFAKELLEHQRDYDREMLVVARELRSSCRELQSLIGENFCGDTPDEVVSGFNTRTVTLNADISSVETVDGDTLVTIQYNRTMVFLGNSTSQSSELTFVVEKINDLWYIVDYVSNNTRDSSHVDLVEYRREIDSLREEDILVFVNTLVARAKYEQQLSTTVRAEIARVVGEPRILDVQVGFLSPTSNEVGVKVHTLHRKEFLGDDYLIVARDSTRIYERSFGAADTITSVEVHVSEEVTDAYGHDQLEFLAKTHMTRETHTRINWDGFAHERLAEVTPFAFYGDSLYKSLIDLQASLNAYESVSSQYRLADMGAPASLCADAQAQCRAYGECETIDVLKSLGTC